ncbi:hypothetical protein D3C87_1839900 [compost metagenome]
MDVLTGPKPLALANCSSADRWNWQPSAIPTACTSFMILRTICANSGLAIRSTISVRVNALIGLNAALPLSLDQISSRMRAVGRISRPA